MEDVITIAANLSTKGFEKGTKDIARAVKSLSNTAKSFGRTMISSIVGVGSVIGILTKAIGSYMSQNEELSQRMNAIWTALGNVLGPIIEQIIEWVSTAVSYFLSFLKLLGVTGKSASELSKSAKKNVQELQKTILGFDELNVLQDNSSSDQGDKSNPLKDIEPSEFMKKFADLLKSGMFEEAGRELARKLNEMVANIPWGELGAKLRYYFMGVLDFLYGVIDEFDWKALGLGIRDFIVNLFENPEEIADKIMRLIKAAWDAVLDFMWGLFWGDTEEEPPLIAAFRNLGDAIMEFYEEVKPVLKEIYENYVKPLFEYIIDSVLPTIINQIADAIRDIGDVLSGKMKLSEFIGQMSTLEGIIIAILGYKLLDKVKGFGDGILKYLIGGATGTGGTGLAGAAQGAEHFGGTLGKLSETLLKIGGELSGTGGISGAVGSFITTLGEAASGLGIVISGMGAFGAAGIAGTVVAGIVSITERIHDLNTIGFAEGGLSAQEYAANVMEMAEKLRVAQENFDTASQYVTDLTMEQDALDLATVSYNNSLQQFAESLGITTEELRAQIEAADGDVTKIAALGDAMSTSADAMNENREAITETNEEYKRTSEEITRNAEEMAEGVNDATEDIKNTTRDNTEEANNAASENAEIMNQNVSGTYSELENEAGQSAEILAERTNQAFEGMSEMSRVWGSDMVANFIDGIDAQIPALEAELRYIADMIAAYIHFTKPDKGPLADFDTYGPDMIKEFISGMEGEKSNLEKAIGDIADTISFQMPTVAGGGFLPYNVSQSSSASGGTDMTQIVERFLSALDSFEESIQNMQLVAQFGNLRLLAEGITREQRRMDRSEGR